MPTMLSSLKLGALLAKAAERGIPLERLDVRDFFLDFAVRDASRGGGTPDEVDEAALDYAHAAPTLGEIIAQAQRLLAAETPLAEAIVALVVENDGEVGFVVLAP